MLTSRLNLPIPGGRKGNAPGSEQEQDPENIAAGIVDKTGQVVDEAGKPVAKITEGNPKDLTGNVVSATGNIIGATGDIVGKAVPISEDDAKDAPTSDLQKKGGLGALNLEGVTDTVGDTTKTVNKLQPLTGQLSKVLGGGQSDTPASGKVEKEVEDAQINGTRSDINGVTEDQEDRPEPTNLQDKSITDVGGTKQHSTDDAVPKVHDEEQRLDAESDIPQQDDITPQDSVSVAQKAKEDNAPEDDVPVEKTREGVKEDIPAHESVAQKEPGKDDISATDAPASEVKDDVPGEVAETGPPKDEAAPTEAGTEVPAEDAEPEEKIDYSILKDCKVNKAGNVVNDEFQVVGRITQGILKQLVGRKTDENGEIWNDSGKVIGKAEPIPESERDEVKEPAPFEDFPDAVIESNGKITHNGEVIGRVVEGDPKKLKGKKVDEDGDILDRSGNVLGKAERWEEEEPKAEEPEPEGKIDYSILKDCKVNKAGNVVNDKSQVVGRITQGIMKHLIGRKTDENGEIWNDSGKIIGKAEPIPESERDEFKEPAPFEDFPDAVIESNGKVTHNGEVIGRVIEGDPKKLKGKKVDEDGDILDRSGNVLGKAERWEEEEPEPEPEPEPVDKSILAGKRVNKLGNVVDNSGQIFGRLIEGDPKRLAGRMCDKEGNVRSESGDIIGKAELVSEGEREGLKEGPFAELPGCTVSKDGKIVTPSGDVVGRLVKGDPKVLYGRAVDEDGDILDKNGNSLGKAERWEEPVVEKEKNPMCGRKVNREGNVVDQDGNVIGKLTSGELSICSGKEIDNDGDVVDSKGNTIGHVSLLADIPAEPEPEETAEEKEKRELSEQDKKLAKQMATTLTQCLDKIRPICKMITQKIDKAERTPKEELDEEALVKEVRPLIEEGSKILQEANGIIRGLDPDGHIQANAKHKTASKEASPEEYHLADVLKELTGTVTECIDNAKKKIEDMPHAKQELNPLWGLLTEPLFQILAAVGLLLNGVLELVGRLLSGLGLGQIVNNILGGLGITNVLKSLGVGSAVDALTGKNKDKKKKSGGLFS
jgi:hypothetical protein